MMNTAVNTPAEAVIEDLISCLESGTGKPEDWSEDIRTFKTPVIVCDGTLSILEANEAFFA